MSKVIFAACLFLPSLLFAQTTWHVATNGLDTNDGLSWNAPFLTIAFAVGAASNDDSIVVSNGIYQITASIPLSKGVHLKSVNGLENTMITRGGAGSTRIVSMTHADAVLDGFTITNGKLTTASQNGGGISMTAGTITNCLIIGNTSNGGSGGGIYCVNGTIVNSWLIGNSTSNDGGGVRISDNSIVNNCIVSGNYAANYGGGVYSTCNLGSRAALRNCVISSNNALLRGGGVYINVGLLMENCEIYENKVPVGSSQAYSGGGGVWAAGTVNDEFTIRNCLFYNNYSIQSGGGLLLYSAGIGAVQNCTIVSNYAKSTHANAGGGGICIYANPGTGPASIDNSIIYYNNCARGRSNWYFHATSGTYTVTNCCLGWGAESNIVYAIPSATRGGGNITNAPLFVNTNICDYHLNAGSPCRNTGINQVWMNGATDLDKHNRIDIFSGIVDIGCYEYLLCGSKFNIK